MNDCGMLYDGQAKAGSAHRLGPAFVHPVKTFKDPLLFRLGDTDPGIADGDQDSLGGGIDVHGYTAAFPVIFDCVVT